MIFTSFDSHLLHKQVHILSRNKRRIEIKLIPYIEVLILVGVIVLFLLLQVGISIQMAPAYFLVFFLLSYLLLPLSAEEKQQNYHPKDCLPYYCGDPKENEDSGWLTVDNCTEPVQKIQLEMGSKYDVVSISPAYTISLDEYSEFCKCESPENLLPSTSPPSITFTTTSNLKCNHGTPPLKYFGYSTSSVCERFQHETPSSQCLKSHPPINITYMDNRHFSLSAADIFFQVRVSESCGKCYFKGYDYKGGMCYQDDNGTVHCTNEDKGTTMSRLKLALVITGASAAGMGVLMFIIYFLMRIKFSSNKSPVLWKKETQNHQNVVAFLKDYGSLAPKRYSYSDVKKMTYSFKHKLGQGGYGSVYKGKLQNGRLVAVKVLNNSKSDGQEFVNEVASISRTSHVNIVNLLGFCFEGSKRALIYEFMPNGSLEKFIYDENPLGTNRQLGWETLYQIAIGIARGLEYLHRGCNTQILHFDIKPHNILLDEDLCPKISDFGLAKLCPGKQSIISMLDARGTAGYIAPEVFCRSIGGVSHKSDVYSYGMMVLEMVGGRKNIDVGVDHTSQIYFPHWIHKRLEHGGELGLHGIMNEEENEKARKMILVGLWCIQTNPSNRPPMCRVLDMLQGSFGSLQIPPCPFLSSPPRSPVDSSTTPIVAS